MSKKQILKEMFFKKFDNTSEFINIESLHNVLEKLKITDGTTSTDDKGTNHTYGGVINVSQLTETTDVVSLANFVEEKLNELKAKEPPAVMDFIIFNKDHFTHLSVKVSVDPSNSNKKIVTITNSDSLHSTSNADFKKFITEAVKNVFPDSDNTVTFEHKLDAVKQTGNTCADCVLTKILGTYLTEDTKKEVNDTLLSDDPAKRRHALVEKSYESYDDDGIQALLGDDAQQLIIQTPSYYSELFSIPELRATQTTNPETLGNKTTTQFTIENKVMSFTQETMTSDNTISTSRSLSRCFLPWEKQCKIYAEAAKKQYGDAKAVVISSITFPGTEEKDSAQLTAKDNAGNSATTDLRKHENELIKAYLKCFLSVEYKGNTYSALENKKALDDASTSGIKDTLPPISATGMFSGVTPGSDTLTKGDEPELET